MVSLQKLGHTWKFQSEANLEDFLWGSLEQLLNVSPIKRQFAINGQICDILAINSEKQLSIIELKNEEDRYIVNQLSRYYDAIFEEQPFPEIIDYEKPIQLIAIAPIFHRDNFIDRKHSRLEFTFFQFEIEEVGEELTFALKDVDSSIVKEKPISYESQSDVTTLPDPSRRLLNLMENLSDQEQDNVLRVRKQILSFSTKLKELSVSNSVLYGSSKSKPCAEFRYDSVRKAMTLFLWLPHVSSRSTRAKKITARMRIWTNWQCVTDLGHVPKGLGRKITLEEWKTLTVRPLNKLLPKNNWFQARDRFLTDKTYREELIEQNKYRALDPSYKSGLALSLQEYLKLVGRLDLSSDLSSLIDLALETWSEKL